MHRQRLAMHNPVVIRCVPDHGSAHKNARIRAGLDLMPAR
jgi:hypothetical protein